MKVTKIHIEKREIDIQSDAKYFVEAQYPPLVTTILKQGEFTPKTVPNVRETYYAILSVKDKYTGLPKQHFAVPTNEHRLFTDLLQVSEEQIKQKIDDGIVKFKEEFYYYDIPKINQQIVEQERERISKLGWWDRLFNNLGDVYENS